MTSNPPICAKNVHVIRIENGPVNSLGHATRTHIAAQLDAAQRDDDILAVVLLGAGKVFSGGADLQEFGTPLEAAEPHLNTVIARLENFPKPVIALLHGVALGGGLELAMGCHYRLATSTCKIALPEIKLGLMPGGGGTQRLSRLTNIKTALQVIVSGEIFSPAHFAQTALFDAVIADGDAAYLEQQAVAFAVAQHGQAQSRRTCERTVTLDGQREELAAARLAAQASARWYPAPSSCVEAIEASAIVPFEQGLALERTLFLSLLESETSKALMYQFFAERAIGKVRDLPAGVKGAVVSSAVMIGHGVVTDYFFRLLTSAGVACTRVEEAEITGVLQHAVLAAADIVFWGEGGGAETLPRLFHQLESLVTPTCLLVTLAHSNALDDIVTGAARPENMAGLYLGEDAWNLPVIEILRSQVTSPQTAFTLMALVRRLGKTGIVAPGRKNFIGPRLLARLRQRKEILAQNGVPERVIDQALREFGFADGPCLSSDAVTAVVDGVLMDDQKIVEYITRALSDEAHLILDESDLVTAVEIDMIFTRGYGFPRHRGGPVFYQKEQRTER
jgi:3-hydroxyacyl-CoA dehydrogenase